jgi:hypothetical protein
MFNSFDDLKDWSVSDQSDEYPRYFRSYTQAMMELDKNPNLAVQEHATIDEVSGGVGKVWIVLRKDDIKKLMEKY